MITDIIGGADGPTAIFTTTSGFPYTGIAIFIVGLIIAILLIFFRGK